VSAPASGGAGRRGGRRAFWLAFAAILAGGLVLANAHLVYVAIGSQPGCVPHAKTAGEPGLLRAAGSSC
jgi:hypothetical protein